MAEKDLESHAGGEHRNESTHITTAASTDQDSKLELERPQQNDTEDFSVRYRMQHAFFLSIGVFIGNWNFRYNSSSSWRDLATSFFIIYVGSLIGEVFYVLLRRYSGVCWNALFGSRRREVEASVS